MRRQTSFVAHLPNTEVTEQCREFACGFGVRSHSIGKVLMMTRAGLVIVLVALVVPLCTICTARRSLRSSGHTAVQIELLDFVTLREDLREKGLAKGQLGQVERTLRPGSFEVEFYRESKPYARVVLGASRLRLVTELTPELLAQAPEDVRSWMVVRFVDHKHKSSHDGRCGKDCKVWQSLSKGVRAVCLIWQADSEINNGGFSQFFLNSTGEWADETVEALELVGAREHAEMLKKAIGIVKSDPEGAMSAKLYALDEKWYATTTPDIECRKYIKTRPEEFRALCTVSAAEVRPIVGAIRWDAWHAGAGPADAMKASLGPRQYHYRLPFFAKVVSDSEVEIGGYTQEIVDREIAFAKAGGIDYWAFLLYDPDSPMSNALSFYLKSKKRRDVRFCAIVQAGRFGRDKSSPDRFGRIIDLMARPEYQRVLGDRPLLYVFDISDERLQAWGGESGARKLFDQFRGAARAKGLKTPYIVVMDTQPTHGYSIALTIGAQALSSYAIAGDHGKGGKPYTALAEVTEKFWDQCAETGMEVVPLAMAGWDRRPRIEHPVPWEKYQKPGEGIENFYHMPTPDQLAGHIRAAICWAAVHRDKCPAQAVLVYAWNEHDEGGYLCPTLNPDGTPNTERLDAIRRILDAFELPCSR